MSDEPEEKEPFTAETLVALTIMTGKVDQAVAFLVEAINVAIEITEPPAGVKEGCDSAIGNLAQAALKWQIFETVSEFQPGLCPDVAFVNKAFHDTLRVAKAVHDEKEKDGG